MGSEVGVGVHYVTFCGSLSLEAMFPRLNEGKIFLAVVLLPRFTTVDNCSLTSCCTGILPNME